jgi:signal transduction histidine kinase/ActR/RegA family two-component response regulator
MPLSGRVRAVTLLKGALAAALLVPALGVGLLGYFEYHATIAETRAAVARSVDVAREHAVKVFETHELVAARVDEMLRGLSDGEILAREFEFHERVAGFAGELPQIQDLWVIGAEGRALLSANIFPIPREVDFADRDYFVAHAEDPERGTFIGDLLIGRVDPSRVFFQVSVRRSSLDGSFNGVIAVSVEPDYFRRFFARFVTPDPGSFAALVRSDGARLARMPESEPGPFRMPPDSEFLRAIRSAPGGGVYETVSSTTGIDSIVGYRRVPDTPVYAAIAVPRSVPIAQWQRLFAWQLALAVPATLALCGVTWVALRRTRSEQAALLRVREETERRRELEDQLRQSQKLEAIGQLTGGVAHDFNNLLTVIVGGLEAILRRPSEIDRVKRFAQAALTAAARGERLTQQLLAFARRQTLRPEVTEIGALIGEVRPLLRRAVGEGITLNFELRSQSHCLVDPGQFEAALLNLVVNARDAAPSGGQITIRVTDLILGPGEVPETPPGRYLQVSVIDTGVGMSAALRARVFEPFFTTKEFGKGSGLGLSQVYGFVRQSGGGVTIDSSEGRGTTISMFLPISDQQAQPARPRGGALQAVEATGPILVAEDDPEVRTIAIGALSEAGYRVLAAADGPAALEILAKDPQVALLFTDVVMPGGLSGTELVRRALAIRPDLSVVLTSGYAPDPPVEYGAAGREFPFIPKPYRTEELIAAINAALCPPARAGGNADRPITV